MKKKFLLFASIPLCFIFSSCHQDLVEPQTSNTTQNSMSAGSASDEALLTVSTALFIGDNTGFYCLNASDGSSVWSYKTTTSCESVPCKYLKSVIYNAGDTMYSLTLKNGTLVWKKKTGHIRSAPCIANGRLFITLKDKIICLNADNGNSIWSHAFGTTTTTIQSSPTVSDSIVYVSGGNDKTMYALSAATGAVVWKRVFTYDQTPISSPCIAGNTAYISLDSAYSLDKKTGALLAARRVEGNGADPTVENGRLVIPDDRLFSFNAANGSVKWTFTDTSSSHKHDFNKCFAQGNDVWGQFTTSMYDLDGATGNIKWEAPVEDSKSSFIVNSGVLYYVGFSSGHINAISATTGQSLWTSTLSTSSIVAAPIIVTSSGNATYPTKSGMRQ